MSGLVARLIEAGTPPELIEEVAMLLAEKRLAETAISERRGRDRERQARHRNVTSRDITDVTATNEPAPLSRPPNEEISNPPTHTPPNITPRARADLFPCPEGVDQTDWQALKANRKAKRAALTEGAHRQIVRKLEGWARDGWPPGPIVAVAAERGWTTVFETDEMKAPANARIHRQQPDKRNGIALALDRRLGLGEPAREAGRYPDGSGQEDRGRTLALVAPVR